MLWEYTAKDKDERGIVASCIWSSVSMSMFTPIRQAQHFQLVRLPFPCNRVVRPRLIRASSCASLIMTELELDFMGSYMLVLDSATSRLSHALKQRLHNMIYA